MSDHGAPPPTIDRRTDTGGLREKDAEVHAYVLDPNTRLVDKILYLQASAEQINKNHKSNRVFNKLRERWGSSSEVTLAKKVGDIEDHHGHDDIGTDHYERKAKDHKDELRDLLYELGVDMLEAHGESASTWREQMGSEDAYKMLVQRLQQYTDEKGAKKIQQLAALIDGPGDDTELGQVYKVLEEASQAIMSPQDRWLSNKIKLLDSVHPEYSDKKKKENKEVFETFMGDKYKLKHDIGVEQISNSSMAFGAISKYQTGELPGQVQQQLHAKEISRMDESPTYSANAHGHD